MGRKEAAMWGEKQLKRSLKMFIFAVFLLSCAISAQGQELRSVAVSTASPSLEAPADVRALAETIRGLQSEVQTLNSQLGDLRREQEHASDEARALRRELELVKAQTSPAASGSINASAAPSVEQESAAPMIEASSPASQSPEDRISKLEENQEVLEGKINDQYQTKVESGSKYRLRLSGIVLLNLFENRGTVDNEDFPALAESRQANEPNASPGTFGGTLRQSQIRLQAFGPDIAGARTSADVNLDFAGGLVNAPNGAWMGVVRMRTAIVRLDWTNTSIVAGQDRLFFAPLAPTSLAALAIPALSYSGNLWAWMPQVRVEHRIALSEAS